MHRRESGQLAKRGEDGRALTQRSERDFADDRGWQPIWPCSSNAARIAASVTQVFDPDGGVGQGIIAGDGRAPRRGGVARMEIGLGSTRAASRRALSRAISARSPSCTNAVFSATPVRPRARSISTSSRISVCSHMYQYA
jgi:hypothetical protein